MDREKIAEFTRRISQSNQSGLTLITYDILFAYLEDAKKMHACENAAEYKKDMQQAIACTNRLMDTLDFRYPIAKELYPIYRYCRDELSRALMLHGTEQIEVVIPIMQELQDAFAEVSKADTSQPVMQNSEKVVAGLTYQKNDLTENAMLDDNHRGFLA